MNQEKKILAVDVGYSNLKRSQTTAKSEEELATYIRADDETRASMDISFDMSVMPAGALPTASMPDDAFGTGSKGVPVLVDGVEWTAGIRVTTNTKIQRHLTPEYKRTDEWKALFNAALVESKWDDIDLLVLGLPCDEVYTTKTKEIEYLKSYALGEHEVAKGKRVMVHDVLIVAQPLGSIAGYFVADAAPEERAQMLEQSTTLVVDPGYYSCDIVLLHDGAIMKETAFSSQNSVREICQEIERKINTNFPDSPCQLGEVEEQIRKGSYLIPLKGKAYDFSEDLMSACESVARQAITEIESRLHSHKIYPRVTMLTGGGANLFGPTFNKEMNTDKLLIAKAPVVLNCFGYLYWGIKKLHG